ncbi:MAG: GGDEF domain-containing protein [Burkholderiales bacterium]|jgi:diguanylate cyclase (GGDEF)-like protein|nr:GGDEF domain-containing protein [Burkholderiales bacterium]
MIPVLPAPCRRLCRAVAAAALLLWSLTATAQTGLAPLKLDGSAGNIPAAQAALALEDPGHALQVEDVARAHAAGSLRPVLGSASRGEINFGYSKSAWWLALPLQAPADAPARWLLEIGYASLDRVEVHVPRAGGGFERMVAGDLQPFSERPHPHRNLVFPLQLRPGQEQVVYLRVVSAGNLTIPLALWQPDALARHDQTAYTVLSLYYGMLLALGLYNLLLFMTTRDINFLAYVAFTAAMAVGQASMNGFGNQFIWPEWPAWGNVALPSGMAATGFFGALFTRLFLETRRGSKLLDRAILGCALLFALAALSPLLLPYQAVAVLVSVLGITFSAVAVAAGLWCLRRGHPGARYFLLAWTLLLVGVAVLAMRNLGWLPTNAFTLNAMQIGSALEVLLLSFALADRINAMRRDKDRANEAALAAKQEMVEILRDSEQRLEERVAERTRSLELLNQRLLAKERELEHMVRHDPLTGLANRLFLNDRIEQAITRARRNKSGVALLVIDLDGFKQVNDLHGHATGDELLVRIAGRLRECVRETDTVARLGGDEFVVMLESVRPVEDISVVVEKLVARIRQPVQIAGGSVEVSASIGIACWPQHAGDAEQLLERADAAMYAAKTTGRNRWAMAADSQTA